MDTERYYVNEFAMKAARQERTPQTTTRQFTRLFKTKIKEAEAILADRGFGELVYECHGPRFRGA